ncbi:ATP-binding protein [Bacillus sonorensis]|nr:ATP-binding protein [Bacillus sonorensis]
MLAEIRSRIFKDEIIKFHQGLNVVLGDNQGSNSIGKSTLLMILDFIFGGNTYILHNKDVITKFGDHDFGCTFKFKRVHFILLEVQKILN